MDPQKGAKTGSKIDTFLRPFSRPLLGPLLITFGSKMGPQMDPKSHPFLRGPTLQNHETVIKISPIQLSKWHPFGNPFLDPTFRSLFLLWSDLLGVHLGSIFGSFFGTIFGTNFGPQKTSKKNPVLAREREARCNILSAEVNKAIRTKQLIPK